MRRLLPASLVLFVVCAFALPTEAAFSLVFYVCVLPMAMFAWASSGRGGYGPRRITAAGNIGFLLALALVLWSGLTLAWGDGDFGRTWHFLLGVAATAAFLVALQRALAVPDFRRRLAAVLIWAGGANAVVVLMSGAPVLLRGDRILGWGITRQPILGGSVMAVACLTALVMPHFALRAGGPCRKDAQPQAGFAAATIMATFIVAMQSRGALVGLAGGILVLGWHFWRWRSLLVFAACSAVLAIGPIRELLQQRGTSHRLEIWAATWRQIAERPLFGHGLAANLPISSTGFPHSLYLSLLFYSGAIGLALFCALAAMITHRLLRAHGPERAWVAALWVNALLAGVTDFGQITKGPGPLWFILWLPVMLALTLPVTPRASAADLPAAAR